MKEWYSRLKFEYQIAFWSLIAILGLFLLTIPCFFFSLMEIPQGILLGGMVGALVYIFLGLFNNENNPKKSLKITVVIIIIKFLVIAGVLFLVGWLYYGLGFKAFNIFAVMGGYFIPLAVHIILVEKEKSSGNS